VGKKQAIRQHVAATAYRWWLAVKHHDPQLALIFRDLAKKYKSFSPAAPARMVAKKLGLTPMGAYKRINRFAVNCGGD